MMAYFTEDFNQFFKDLAANNHKEWFDENRKRYHKSVKEPFEAFIADLIEAVKVYEPSLDMAPKDAIYRINRDIRFAKDKTPYKLNRSALVSKYGRKDSAHPALYIELGPERVYLVGGSYQPEKDQLNAIREAIMKDPDGFRNATSSADFKKYFGELKGEENKRLPNAEMTRAAEKFAVLYKKAFYYETHMEPEIVTDPKLIDKIMHRYKAGQKVHAFLEYALAERN